MSRRDVVFGVGASVLALGLSGCGGGGLFGGSSTPPTFDLTAAQNFPRRARPGRGQLVVSEPNAVAPLDGTRIVVRPMEGEITLVSNAQWVDRIPKLVQARMIESFENAGRMRRIGRPGDRFTADYVLVTDLRALQITIGPSGPVAEVEIAAKLTVDVAGRVVAARVVRGSVSPAGTDGPGAVAAIDAAFHQAMVELVLWTSSIL